MVALEDRRAGRDRSFLHTRMQIQARKAGGMMTTGRKPIRDGQLAGLALHSQKGRK